MEFFTPRTVLDQSFRMDGLVDVESIKGSGDSAKQWR